MIMLILTPLAGMLGVFLLAYGVWLIYSSVGFVIVGALCLSWSWPVARYFDHVQLSIGGGK